MTNENDKIKYIRPLAERMRPTSIDEICGQEKVIKQLKTWLERNYLPSLILWGPPGCGKTSLAPLLAKALNYPYHNISAIFSSVAELKKIFDGAEQTYALSNEPTILFVDETHRFNKAQQDIFLPVIEKGTVILIGATTENPSFNLNNALLSRCQVLTLNPLSDKDLTILANRAIKDTKLSIKLMTDAIKHIVNLANGDARYLLQTIESLSTTDNYVKPLTIEQVNAFLSQRPANHDKSDDQHYNLISALHKCIRASDVHASLYWLARMLEGGENPRYILRRLIRMAMEDIGLASPQALNIALDCANAYERLGSPEGDIALTQCVIYLATAPKSNSVEVSHKKALTLAKKTHQHPPPRNIINAPNKFMKDIGFSYGYVYDHDLATNVSAQKLWPDELTPEILYRPIRWGFEATLAERLKDIEVRRQKSNA